MAPKNKAYAIRCGRDPVTKQVVRNRILDNWPETYRLVHGAPGAVYAGFPTAEEAKAWLEAGSQSQDDLPETGKVTRPARTKTTNASPAQNGTAGTGVPKKSKKLPEEVFAPDLLRCYVDGSFNDSVPNYGFGLVCVLDGAIVHSAGGAGKNTEAVSMRQIAGELLGAMQGLVFARRNGYRKVVVLHDYMGVAHHATGVWKRTNPFSITYYDWMQAFFRENPDMQIAFKKVPAHAGNLYNELADVLAKRSVGMVPDAEWLAKARELGVVDDRQDPDQS